MRTTRRIWGKVASICRQTGCDRLSNSYLLWAVGKSRGFSPLSRNGAGLVRIGGLEGLCRGLYYIRWSRDGVAKVQPECNAPTMRFPFAKTDIAIRGSRATNMADDDRKRRNEQGGPGTAVITKTKPQTKRPNMYRVLILNDDYTPMEFVVHVLERFFGKDHEAATRIMLHVHHHGIGECGVYTYEVAETKVTQVMDFARKHQHPLQCVMEKK